MTNYRILTGDNREQLKTIPDSSIDSIVTDPPYGIDFLGKDWDANTGALETYQECLRVLKPGGHILAFSAARTYHHLAITLEQAGFEIRDQIMWIYSSGFPKSQDVGRSIQRSLGVKKTKTRKGMSSFHKENYALYNPDKPAEYEYNVQVTEVTDPEAKAWEGWGTALKPAHEPICLARKPTKLSIAKNVQEYGTGALNIDACRIERVAEKDRFPSNVIGEIADYQKYYYCPKVSRKERHLGFDTTNIPTNPDGMMSRDEKGQLVNNYTAKKADAGNNHPTVKPIALMEYLIKLVTPAGGHVLDPFNGSGSTGCAAVGLGYEYTGIELDPRYVEISNRRIESWTAPEPEPEPNNLYHQLFE